MTHLSRILTLCFVLFISANGIFAQEEADTTTVHHRIVKHNGVTMVGKILSQDAREVLIETVEIGQVIIPKHEIKEIIQLERGAKSYDENLFATRYFLTTNGFPVKKGDSYIQWNIFGPDFQFGIADNFGVGIMTSWFGIPVIGTAKYSRELGENVSGGLGFLAGTGSWAAPDLGLLLPFSFITFGDRVNNINFSAGYGGLFLERNEYDYTLVDTPNNEWETNRVEYNSTSSSSGEGRLLLSVAGMFKINSKFSFVFDSFFMLPGKDWEQEYIDQTYDEKTGKYTNYIRTETQKAYSLLVLTPGLRFQTNPRSSFQFGFTGVNAEGDFLQVPIPMIQWFRKI